MKPKKYKVMIDIYKGVLNNQLIEFTTQDHGSNVLEFEILEDKVTPYNLDGCLVRMVINGQQQDCTIADATNGLVNITLHQSMFSEVGPVFAELQIYDALNQTIRLTTPIFKYTVKKSLMDDETVQADPNYSILQNMILEVSSADEVAKQAKKTAESAMATANQAESKANQIMSNGDYAKEQGDYAKAEGDRLQGMLTLGGAPQTKFDFIENKVVQDGLIYENRVVTNRVNSGIILTNNFTISMTLSASSKTDNQYFLGNYSDSRGLYLFCNNGVIKLIIDTIALDTIKPEPNEFYNVSIVCIEGECSVFINGIKYTHTVRYVPNNIRLAFGGYNGSSGELGTGKLKNVLIYNLPRAPQEIQNNFSVLNNLPSIKELHTTDSTGKTSILKLASDADHVEDRSGRTQDQINRTFYKRMCKEIPSPNGEPITVENGEEGYVLSGEIKGQTVKNYGTHNNASQWNGSEAYVFTNKDLFCAGAYTFKSNTITKEVMIEIVTKDTGQFIKNATFTNGIFNIILKDNETISKIKGHSSKGWSNDNRNEILNFVIVEQSYSDIVDGSYFDGLSSTPAIISNNGQQYPIYEPTIQGKTRILDADTGLVPTDPTLPALKDGDVLDLATRTITFANKTTRVLTDEEVKAYSAFKKVISLGGVGDVQDTLEILDDGSGIYTKNTKNLVLNGSENWKLDNDGIKNLDTTAIFGNLPGSTDKIRVIGNMYKGDTWNNGWVNDNIVFMHPNGGLFIRDTSIATLEEFKAKLSTTNLEIIGVLAAPIIIHIPKELVPTILTHKTNILEAGGAVKPSSFKVTVPVDKLAEIEARLQALESTTVDVVLNK